MVGMGGGDGVEWKWRPRGSVERGRGVEHELCVWQVWQRGRDRCGVVAAVVWLQTVCDVTRYT